MSRRCTRCGEVKAATEFNRRAAKADGLRSECRTCQALYKKRWYDPERARVKRRASYVADPERHREYARRAHRKRYPVDAEYRARMKERYREWVKVERNRERERVRGANKERRRQAAKRGLPNEAVDREVLFVRDGGLCGICGQPVDPDSFHVDHRIPLVRGGHHTYENTQIAHPRCNLSKGARLNQQSKVG